MGHENFHHRPDPVREAARGIANELDHGMTGIAADHLRRELMHMPFSEQKRLVQKVDDFDRKGVGADLHLGRIDRQNGIWDDIRISPPRYYEDHGRRVPHPHPGVDIRIGIDIFNKR